MESDENSEGVSTRCPLGSTVGIDHNDSMSHHNVIITQLEPAILWKWVQEEGKIVEGRMLRTLSMT